MVTLVSLKAQNFRRLNFQEPLVFPKGFVVIRGRNEAGKSTILEAVLFGLFGDYRIIQELRGAREAGLDSVVNHRSGRARVEVVFEVEGRRYRVERVVERGREGGRQVEARLVEITQGGERLIATSPSRVNEEVSKLVRVNWREMLATNVIAQKDLEHLLRMGKNEREKVINMMMGFESYNKAIEKLEEERRAMQQELEKKVLEKSSLEDKLRNLEELKVKVEEYRRELEEVEKELPALRSEEERSRKVREYLDGLLRVLREREKTSRSIEEVERRIRELEEERRSLEEKAVKLKGELEAQRRRLGELEERGRAVREAFRKAEEERRRAIEFSGKALELLDKYQSLLDEKRRTLERIAELDKRLEERPKLLGESARLAEEARSVESRIAGESLPAWSKVASAALLVASAVLLLVNPALLALSIAGALLAVLSLAAGAYRKSVTVSRLRLERERLERERALVEERLKSLERDVADRESLSKRLEEIDARLLRAEEELKGVLGEEFSKLPLQEVRERVSRERARREEEYERARAEKEALEKEAASVGERVSQLEKQLEEVERSVEERVERLGELAKRREELLDALSRLVVPEPPFEIEGLVWPVDERDIEGVEVVYNTYDRLYQQVSRRLAEAEERRRVLTGELRDAEKKLEELPAVRDRLAKLESEVRELEVEVNARREAVKLLREVSAKRRAAFAPSVEQNMNWIVSYVTNGRYKAVKIDPERYDVSVYDAEAGRWMQRDIYSGGTNDQFLLAMRIAFTLSLLPSAKGTYPRFLFLDEPLGSSDAERRGRIVELLARELTRFFDQVFLITHVDIEEPPGATVVEIEDGKPARIYTPGAEEG
ncbi:AAA family ATPase [Thermofilum pendens]|uniref:SMC domain protein n=1 Tax=Thermofilum pendens (strain DSM 2475 / Hrk 5) TaxID=368408 RepID=A1S0I9_THEPD|nr:SMC family ATPase [Thermofilum pendens]ABL78969.1 SMC domain protein [Thermofilum pendens Hrk 5]